MLGNKKKFHNLIYSYETNYASALLDLKIYMVMKD